VQTTSGKVILIVLDGVGIGELPDANEYADEGSSTLANTAIAVGGLRVPNLAALGLGNIVTLAGVHPAESPAASYGRMAQASRGKDSTTGHWELAGLVVETPFPVYPRGFPDDVMAAFLRETGAEGYLGNVTASGTAIIHERGDEHVRTGYPIVYTSADSVFQIAAHESVIPLQRLHEICRITRERVCTVEHAVSRVIARPFVGISGQYTRTAGRRDFSLEPSGPTLLDLLSARGIRTTGIGKVDDLFARRGLEVMLHTRTNAEGIQALLDAMSSPGAGLILANLGDFDTLYGHRNDPAGFADALAAFDRRLPEILETVAPGDVLILTADHGNDPTTPSTDHSREYVPLLCYVRGRRGTPLGTRKTFADVGRTAAEYFGIEGPIAGTSFLKEVCAW
jgi:phosphopentomutase